jgi:hypothetical protein
MALSTMARCCLKQTQPVYDFAFRDKFIWAATGVEGQVGVTRINLGQEVAS